MNEIKKINRLKKNLHNVLGNFIYSLKINFKEITIVIKPLNYFCSMKLLFNDKRTYFKELIDLCGVDYLNYKNNNLSKKYRFAVVIHLLSIKHNWRLRVKIFNENNINPSLQSITSIWKSANWYEREAFDLFGILFIGHKNLNKILTDYKFKGYPFRKDFPMEGYTEIQYDKKKQCIIHKYAKIEKQNIIPRTIK